MDCVKMIDVRQSICVSPFCGIWDFQSETQIMQMLKVWQCYSACRANQLSSPSKVIRDVLCNWAPGAADSNEHWLSS